MFKQLFTEKYIKENSYSNQYLDSILVKIEEERICVHLELGQIFLYLLISKFEKGINQFLLLIDKLLKDSSDNIVTNSIGIHSLSASITTHPITVNAIPGEVNTVVGAYVGFQTTETAKEQLINGIGKLSKSKVAVLGLRAYDPSKGFLENTPSLKDFQGVLFEYSENLIVVAQGEKFLNKAYAPILESNKFKKILEKGFKRKVFGLYITNQLANYLKFKKRFTIET
jgi:hypothetical protein